MCVCVSVCTHFLQIIFTNIFHVHTEIMLYTLSSLSVILLLLCTHLAQWTCQCQYVFLKLSVNSSRMLFFSRLIFFFCFSFCLYFLCILLVYPSCSWRYKCKNYRNIFVCRKKERKKKREKKNWNVFNKSSIWWGRIIDDELKEVRGYTLVYLLYIILCCAECWLLFSVQR